jgi:hypothetical protein
MRKAYGGNEKGKKKRNRENEKKASKVKTHGGNEKK